MQTRNMGSAAEQNAFIDKVVRSGEYESASEAIRTPDTGAPAPPPGGYAETDVATRSNRGQAWTPSTGGTSLNWTARSWKLISRT